MQLIRRIPAFRTLWLAQILSELGDGIARLVVIFLVAHLSSSPLAFSLVILCQVLPQALLGTFIGPLIDRFKRTHIMAIAGLFRAAVMLGFILAQDSLIGIYILIWLEGMGTLFFEPARSAFIPKIVGKDNITAAVSFSQSTMMALHIIGPAIAGLLIPIGHFGLLFTFTSITFILSAALIYSLRRHEEQPATPSGVTAQGAHVQPKSLTYKESLREGLQTIFSHQGLLALLILVVPIMLVVGVINTNLNPALLHVYKIPAEHFGFISSFIGIGGIIGAAAAPHLLRRFKANNMLLSAVGAIGLCCIAIFPLHRVFDAAGIWIVYAWALALGISTASSNVPLSSLFISIVPDEVRGRGSAIFGSVVQTGTIVGIGLGGVCATLFGVLEATAIAGLLLLVVCVIFPMLKYYKALRQPDSTIPQEKQKSAASSSE